MVEKAKTTGRFDSLILRITNCSLPFLEGPRLHFILIINVCVMVPVTGTWINQNEMGKCDDNLS